MIAAESAADLQGLVAWCRAAFADGYGVVAALALAGMAGGFTHCIGMCGPIVLGQVGLGRDRVSPRRASRLSRIVQATLLPYHLGRATTYATLGALAGGASEIAGGLLRGGWIAVPLLLAAAALLVVQAAGLLGPRHALEGAIGRSLSATTRRLGPILRGGGSLSTYVLGVLLGFLPCGLVYGVLVAAAATGSAAAGAGAMAAFALGTVPGLVLVALTGHGLARRAGGALRAVAVALLLVNAGTVGLLALNAAS